MSGLILPTDSAGAREKAHDAIRALLQDIRDTWGIRVSRVDVEWTAVTKGGTRREVVTAVNTAAVDLNVKSD